MRWLLADLDLHRGAPEVLGCDSLRDHPQRGPSHVCGLVAHPDRWHADPVDVAVVVTAVGLMT
jgi:hypothetical protein